MSTKKQASDRAEKTDRKQVGMREPQHRKSSARTEHNADVDRPEQEMPRHSPTSTYHPGSRWNRTIRRHGSGCGGGQRNPYRMIRSCTAAC